MRLILAHAGDGAAAALAARWGTQALLVVPADLHRYSWRLEVDENGRPRADVDLAGLSGIVSRLGGVSAAELPHVHPQDASYAAAELTATLFAWLSACPLPVVNRPAAGSLNGPGWHPEQWARFACAAGLVVRQAGRRVGLDVATTPWGGPVSGHAKRGVSVTVVGRRWFGPVDAGLGTTLCDLAQAAGTPVLQVLLDGSGRFAAAVAFSAWPDVSPAPVAQALADLLEAA